MSSLTWSKCVYLTDSRLWNLQAPLTCIHSELVLQPACVSPHTASVGPKTNLKQKDILVFEVSSFIRLSWIIINKFSVMWQENEKWVRTAKACLPNKTREVFSLARGGWKFCVTYLSLTLGRVVNRSFQCINELQIMSVSVPLFNMTSLLFLLLLSFVQRSNRTLAHYGRVWVSNSPKYWWVEVS